ncbi:MAG: SGNH/GDSL hydrolase family protein [Bacteroidetes bacterium]|nr:SGNH/GDSL hydrolase family protein [Bacteroidota bacterium]
MKNRLLIVIVVLLTGPAVFAQPELRWWAPDHAEGICIRDSGHIYHRLPAYMQPLVRPVVWNLSLNTAGEYIHFRTTARSMVVRYRLAAGAKSLSHMPETGVSGVDLYAVDRNGNWNWSAPRYKFGDTCTYSYEHLAVDAGRGAMVDFYLYLPLYSTVERLEIGCAPADSLSFAASRRERPVVAYGTSIMQGAVASRPGMAWTNIVGRSLDREVVNLGFSGNGKFERPIFELMAKVDAALYILDCMPNLATGDHKNDDMIKGRIDTGIRVLRAAHPGVPILLTEHADGHIPFDMDTTVVNRYHMASLLMRSVYRDLVARGLSKLYLLTEDEINFDENCTVEGTHPNDIGMMAYAAAYEKKIRQILGDSVGTGRLQRPVMQYRDGYDWLLRHEQVIENTRKTNPRVLLIGNSIVNYWGGEPKPEKTEPRGAAAWEKYMSGFQNAGFGYDRIENVLWRVYHGELDFFTGDQIIVMIGTNNLARDTDEEIVEGLSFLLGQIRVRMAGVKITMVGILPRKGMEERVGRLNARIKRMALTGNYGYADISRKFLKDGKVNMELFGGDGLHPNAAGYMVLGKELNGLAR